MGYNNIKLMKKHNMGSKGLNIDLTMKDISINTKKNNYSKNKPTYNDKINMEKDRESGIKYFEEGNRINDELEYNYYFLQGYKIAERKVLAEQYAKELKVKKLIRK